MKDLSPLTLFLLLNLILHSHVTAQSYLWAEGAGGPEYDAGLSTATDGNGNVYAAGNFVSSSITFDSTTLTNTGTGSSEIFIVKYDSSGNVLWAKNPLGASVDVCKSITTDGIGNVFITGYFNSPTISFDSITLTSTGFSGDIFIAKYDSIGNVLWAISAGGQDFDIGYSIATDDNGNIYLTGSFDSPSITFGTFTLTTAGIFTVKYDNNGNALWAKSAAIGFSGGGTGLSCATDNSGNVFVSGWFSSLNITFDTTTLINAGSSDIFLVKYDAGGNVLWAKGAGGTISDVGQSCATDAGGNVYLTGWFSSPSLVFGYDTLTYSGAEDIFTVKYDGNGNVIWTKGANGSLNEEGLSIATDINSNAYITGYFQSFSVSFGSVTLTNPGSFTSDIFIVKYDSSGNVLWAVSAGEANDDYGESVTTDNNGNVYVTGYFESPFISFSTTTLTNAGTADFFITKLSGTVTGTAENNLSDPINIFPNPNNGKFQLSSTFPNSKEGKTSIYNLWGEEIYGCNSIIACSRVIDISNQPAGIYFLKLFTDEGTQTKKIILQ